MGAFLQDSSFVVQPYRRKALDQYDKQFMKDNDSELWDDIVANVLEEQGFTIELNPRSVYKVEKLFQALAKYEPSKAPKISLAAQDYEYGVNLARACFENKTGECLTLDGFTPELVWHVTTNHKGSAGLTAYGKSKADSYVRAYERGLQIIEGEKIPEPCLAFKRTQENGKTRLVWGYPYSMTAIEGIFARPLIERFKLGNTPMAFGMSSCTQGTIIRVNSYHKKYAYSTDVKSYDSSLAARNIFKAFDILSTWFDLDKSEPTTGVSYRDIWDKIVHYFVYTPIRMPDGYVYKGKRHGVPSGSYFTQMIDSVVNVIMLGAIDHHFHLGVSKDDILVLGDDLLFFSDVKVSLDAIASYATKAFGCQFNAAKSDFFKCDDGIIHFLGRDWCDGLPTADKSKILQRMTQPESYRKYSRDPETREVQRTMLMASYASVYLDAYPIYLKALNRKFQPRVKTMDIERLAYKGVGAPNRDARLSTYALSGLARFRAKYEELGFERRDGANVPLALQYLK